MPPQKSPATNSDDNPNSPPAVGYFRRFFKIILQTILQQKKLRVPLRFARTYGDELCDVAQFTVSDGRIWKVEVKREGQNIWFENGFYEFVKHYSICHGFLLCFKYKGMSNFSVNVLDNSGCEIRYPPHKPVIVIHAENAVNSFVSPPSTSKSKRKVSSELENLKVVSSAKKCESNGKRCKGEEVVVVDITDDEEEDNSDIQIVCPDPGQGSEIFVAANFDEIVSKLPPQSKRAVIEARMYKPKNNGFMVVIRTGDYTDRSRMDVPAAFVNKYRHRITGEKIMVQISDEKQWQKDFVIRTKSRISGGLLLTEGWSNFVNTNLEIGDVCVFEVMNSEKFMLKAIIFQAGLE